jgi:predicted glycosyltransferase
MRGDHTNVLMYSHDTFGLGHLRRSRTIAHALVERLKQLNVLIVSGSSIAGAFDFRARVDFIKVPSVIKLYNGNYTSLSEHIDLTDTLHMRRAIIQSAAEIFRPDIFIVDKEPLGLKGELEPTLAYLKMCGCRLVLGLREVLDAPELICAEWAKTNALKRVEELYDSIWVYGCSRFWNPLNGLDVPQRVLNRMRYMGFLRRTISQVSSPAAEQLPPAYMLVTVGGGGDGASLMHQVLAAREIDPGYPLPIVLILGPFMNGEERQQIHARAGYLEGVSVIDFDSRIEALMSNAKAIVSMGGYNTFCEILSFDKPALLVPRTFPRREQLVRAQRAAEIGLVDILDSDQANDARRMADALRALLSRKRPSESETKIDLDGLERISSTLESYLSLSTERQLEPISA